MAEIPPKAKRTTTPKAKPRSSKASGTGAAKTSRRTAKGGSVEKRARAYFEALAKRDQSALTAQWSPDGVADIVPLRVLRGPAEIGAYFRQLFAAVPDLELTVKRVIADDRQAAVEWRMRGTFNGGSFEGVGPSGKAVELRGFDLLEIENDKLVSNTVYYDGAEFARQVGMLPPQDSGTERAMKGAFNAVTKARQVVNEKLEAYR